MSIDKYTRCPGGTGKQVKHCCKELLDEYETIERKIGGGQHEACVQYIEGLQRKQPDRACLFALKGMLLRALGRWEEARANAAAFVERHPANTTALAESAVTAAVTEDSRSGMDFLQRAMAVSDGKIEARVYEALGQVAEILLEQGQWLAGHALLELQAESFEKDDRPARALAELDRSSAVPLLLKGAPAPPHSVDDAPWKDRLAEAMQPVAKGQWQGAAEKLTALAAEVDDAPLVWRNLAMLRSWLADGAAAAEAWRKYAALATDEEDAVEAEAVAILLSGDFLGDYEDEVTVTWKVGDVDELQVALGLDRRASQVPIDPELARSGDPHDPRALYQILDRQLSESAEGLTPAAIPGVLGHAAVYGARTDRQSELELSGVCAADLAQAKQTIEEIAGELLKSAGEEEKDAQVSASQRLLLPSWHLPDEITPDQMKSLLGEHWREVMLVRWPELKLGVLDGRTPREAAADESCRVRLLAAVMVLDSLLGGMSVEFDYNQLRLELGLPTLGPIDPAQTPVGPAQTPVGPAQTPVGPAQTPVGNVPLVRLHRVQVDKLSDDDLLSAMHRSMYFRADKALDRLARAVIERPGLADKKERLAAYMALVRLERDPEQRLKFLDEGRTAAEAAGESPARWLLMELPERLAQGDVERASELTWQLQTKHIEEPGVAETLTTLLMRLGIIRPDGTPTAPLPSFAQPTADVPDLLAPSGDFAGRGGAGPGGGSRKLILPD